MLQQKISLNQSLVLLLLWVLIGACQSKPNIRPFPSLEYYFNGSINGAPVRIGYNTDSIKLSQNQYQPLYTFTGWKPGHITLFTGIKPIGKVSANDHHSFSVGFRRIWAGNNLKEDSSFFKQFKAQDYPFSKADAPSIICIWQNRSNTWSSELYQPYSSYLRLYEVKTSFDSLNKEPFLLIRGTTEVTLINPHAADSTLLLKGNFQLPIYFPK